MTDANRMAFEADAKALGFDVQPARHKNLSGEPWYEYRDLLTGHRWGGWLARDAEIERMRGLLLWALYHAQGGSSPVGQPIRRALGLGQYDHMTTEQIQQASTAATDAMKPNV